MEVKQARMQQKAAVPAKHESRRGENAGGQS
jgi:hypothetical protein